MPRRNRANTAEIILAKEKGQLFSTPLFGILVFSLDDARPPRFAFIVSTKISKLAYRRNQIKRQLKKATLKFMSQLVLGKVIVFLAKKTILEKTRSEIEKEIKTVFLQASLFRKKND